MTSSPNSDAEKTWLAAMAAEGITPGSTEAERERRRAEIRALAQTDGEKRPEA